MLKKTRFYRGEYLLKENDHVEELFIIMKGILKLEKETHLGKLNILDLYMYEQFGDVYMNMNIKSPIDLKVKTKTAELYLMTKTDFTLLSEEFPNQIKTIIQQAIINTTKLELRLRKRYRKIKTKLGFYEELRSFQKILRKIGRKDYLQECF